MAILDGRNSNKAKLTKSFFAATNFEFFYEKMREKRMVILKLHSVPNHPKSLSNIGRKIIPCHT